MVSICIGWAGYVQAVLCAHCIMLLKAAAAPLVSALTPGGPSQLEASDAAPAIAGALVRAAARIAAAMEEGDADERLTTSFVRLQY